MTEYETKYIEYNEDGSGAYDMLITRVDLGDKRVAGFSGVTFIFTFLETMDCYYDSRRMCQDKFADDDDFARDFFRDMDYHFDKLEDGEIVTPQKF